MRLTFVSETARPAVLVEGIAAGWVVPELGEDWRPINGAELFDAPVVSPETWRKVFADWFIDAPLEPLFEKIEAQLAATLSKTAKVR